MAQQLYLWEGDLVVSFNYIDLWVSEEEGNGDALGEVGVTGTVVSAIDTVEVLADGAELGTFEVSRFPAEMLESLGDVVAVAVELGFTYQATESQVAVPDTVEQVLELFRTPSADQEIGMVDGADVTIPTMIIVGNTVASIGHYRPRWLIRGIISGVARRYSSEDFEV